MASLTLLLIVAITSAAAVLAGRRRGLRRAGLRNAVMATLDYLGLAVLFLAANLVVGITLVLLYRALSGQFVSMYVLNDVTLPFLSLLQALVLHAWRQRSR